MPCWADPVWHPETVGGDQLQKAAIQPPRSAPRARWRASGRTPFPVRPPPGDKAHGQDMPVLSPPKGGQTALRDAANDVNLRASMVVPGSQGGFRRFPRVCRLKDDLQPPTIGRPHGRCPGGHRRPTTRQRSRGGCPRPFYLPPSTFHVHVSRSTFLREPFSGLTRTETARQKGQSHEGHDTGRTATSRPRNMDPAGGRRPNARPEERQNRLLAARSSSFDR